MCDCVKILKTMDDPDLPEWFEQFGPKGPFYGSWFWKAKQVGAQSWVGCDVVCDGVCILKMVTASW